MKTIEQQAQELENQLRWASCLPDEEIVMPPRQFSKEAYNTFKDIVYPLARTIREMPQLVGSVVSFEGHSHLELMMASIIFDVQEAHVEVVGRVLTSIFYKGGFLTNPGDGLYHPNMREQNKLSRRSEESVTSWRYMVVESDVADPEDWLRAVVQLPLQIVAIYTSGGKSIHLLVRVDAGSKTEWDEIKNELKPVLVTLGADPAALTAVRLSRLPQCWRGDKMQELLYLSPDADGTPIIQMAEKKGCHNG